MDITTTLFLILFLAYSSAQPTHPTIQRLCEPYADDATPCLHLMRTTMQPELLTALTHILSDLDSCINKTIAIQTSLIHLLYTATAPPPKDSAAYRSSNACIQLYVRALAEFLGAVQELQLGRLKDLEARAKSGLRYHEECDVMPVVHLLDPSLKDTTKQVKGWVDNVVVVHDRSKKILDSFRDNLPATI